MYRQVFKIIHIATQQDRDTPPFQVRQSSNGRMCENLCPK